MCTSGRQTAIIWSSAWREIPAWQWSADSAGMQAWRHAFCFIFSFFFSRGIIPSAVLLQLFSVGVHGFFPTQVSQSCSRKESTNKGVNLRSIIRNTSTTTKTELPTVTLKFEDVPLVEFMYLVFTCMPGESCHRRLRSLLLYLCYVFWAQISSLVGWFRASALGLLLFQIFYSRKAFQ